MIQRLRRSIARRGLLPPGSRVLAAVSGGSDSVALAVLLGELSEHGGFSLVGLAHLNHQLRPDADRDEAFCREFAQRLHLPIRVESVDVRSYAARERLSIEDAARRLRYDFLERAAVELGADRIAVGHTEDDQAETFLLKLIRGAGATGLGGIYPRKGAVVRPLLELSRAALRDYLRERAIPWVEDETNTDVSNPRNRLRHRAIPELEAAAGGQVRGAIARAADLVREDSALLDQMSARVFEDVSTVSGTEVVLDARRLTAEPEPIVRRVLLSALRRTAGGREITLAHVRAALDVLAGACGGTDVPGARLELRREKLVLTEQGSPASDTLTRS